MDGHSHSALAALHRRYAMRRLFRPGLWAAVLVLAAAFASMPPAADAASVCGEGTYAYAGFVGSTVVRGVSARIEQAGPLSVRDGHVAAWIGVVDPTTGQAWLQVGLSALPGQTTSSIYYEYAAHGVPRTYRQVRAGIGPGEQHTLAVVEQARNPGHWVVWVDGRPAGPPLWLPGSRHRWTAQVLGESWAGSTSGTCNAYTYAFSNVRLTGPGRSTGLAGHRTADPNYTVTNTTQSSFIAASTNSTSVRQAQIATPPSPPASQG